MTGGMSMSEDRALIALSQAVKLERQGREFYLKAAEEAEDEKVHALFLSLASDEKMHEEIVLRQLEAIEGGGNYVLLPNLSVKDIDLDAKLFPAQIQETSKRVGTNPTMADAFHLALENEMRSYDLYRAAAKDTEDEAGKRMYQWLASAEMTHFDLLMNNYEAMISLGGWV
jgi:rubrerythrin